jgi:hypothetical protein
LRCDTAAKAGPCRFSSRVAIVLLSLAPLATAQLGFAFTNVNVIDPGSRTVRVGVTVQAST